MAAQPDPVRELVRLERLDWRLYGRFLIPSERRGRFQPGSRWARVERARAVVHAKVVALKASPELAAAYAEPRPWKVR